MMDLISYVCYYVLVKVGDDHDVLWVFPSFDTCFEAQT